MRKSISRRDALTGAGAAGVALACSPALAKTPSPEEGVSIEAARELWRRYQTAFHNWSDAEDAADEIKARTRKRHRGYDSAKATFNGKGPYGSGVYLYRSDEHDRLSYEMEATCPFVPVPLPKDGPCAHISGAVRRRANRQIKEAYRAELRRMGYLAARRKAARLRRAFHEIEDRINESPDASPAMLLLKLAVWREDKINLQGEPARWQTSGEVAGVHSAYALLAAQTGFDPNREALEWRASI